MQPQCAHTHTVLDYGVRSTLHAPRSNHLDQTDAWDVRRDTDVRFLFCVYEIFQFVTLKEKPYRLRSGPLKPKIGGTVKTGIQHPVRQSGMVCFIGQST